MARVSKRKAADQLEAYWYNPDISLVYEIKHETGNIAPGTLIKIRGERAIFRFDRLVVNSKTGKEWLDCFSTEGFGWASFETNRLAGVYVAKRSRKKKITK